MRQILSLLLLFAPLPAQTVTFSQQIAPIVFKSCTPCHRPGEAAPFSLLNYEDAAKRGRLIAGVTKTRYMPPWKAEPASYPYHDSRRLSDAQIALIQQWVKDGMPQGDPAKTPELPKFPEGWQLGPPDLVVKMPKPFEVPAEGPDIYRNVIIPLNLAEDKYVRAIELRPSARRVVHHVLYFADTTGEARKAAAVEEKSNLSGMKFTRGMVPLGGMAVGAQPHLLPEGLALPLPKGSDLVFQYHFHPTGKKESEQSTIGIYLAAKAPSRTLMNIQLPPVYGVFSGVDIPPGEKNFRVKDSFVLPVDVDAISTGAHAHYIGKAMKLTATLPDGTVKTLLDIKDWDFSWQDRYYFEKFVALPKGTRLDGEVSWDNSEGNRRNPTKPPMRVEWGEQSADEMGSVSVVVVPHAESGLKMLQTAYRQHVSQTALFAIQKDPEFIPRLRQKFGGQLPIAPGMGLRQEKQ